jgi:hypothetical protein
VERRERTFTRAALDCVACHRADAQRASTRTVDHARAPFTQSCGGCHEPTAFTPARLPAHEACFPLARTVHAPVRCAECHGSLAGAPLTGVCGPVAVRCADCHEHSADVEERHHRGVQGYQHESERCVGCHRPR